MAFSDEHFRLQPMQTALEWFLFKAVAEAKNPSLALADFQKHMADRANELRTMATEKISDLSPDTFGNMFHVAGEIEELSTEMSDTVRVT